LRIQETIANFIPKAGTCMNSLVLVVDAVASRCNTIQYALEHAGYLVENCGYRHVLEVATQRQPAALVIAIDLPGRSGIDLCCSLREYLELKATGIVAVADSKMSKNRVVLGSSAAVCVSTPFAPGEIALAVETAVKQRREAHCESAAGDDSLIINSSTMRVMVGGKEIPTTPLEFRLIDYMAHNQGREFTRDALLDAVWGDLLFVTPRSVDSCVRRIRRKLEHDAASPTFLKSIRGVGYKLEAKPIWESEEPCQCAMCSAAHHTEKQRSASRAD